MGHAARLSLLFWVFHFSATAGPLAFHYTPQQIDTACRDKLGWVQGEIDRIAAQPVAHATFKSTALALEEVTTEFYKRLGPVLFLESVSPDRAVRDAALRCSTEVQRFFIEALLRDDLYAALKSAKAKVEPLSPEESQLLDETLLGLRRSGLELPVATRRVLAEKRRLLVDAQNEFSKNLAEWKDELWVTRQELEGLSQSYIDALERAPDGRYKLTLDYPTYTPFLENAKDGSARSRLEHKFLNRGGQRNRELLEKAITLRHEIAALLGYPTHAAYVLEQRMAKTPAAVDAFLRRLIEKLRPYGQMEKEELLRLKRAELGDPALTELLTSDWRYYANQLRKQLYHVDPEAVRAYFPLEKVLEGMFGIYQTLFGVTFVRETQPDAWHESVLLYRIERQGATVAYFYMDLFPREGKYSHAAAFTLQSGYQKNDGTYSAPISAIVANFTPSLPGKPSLLRHSEVETLFHEFGHIMHQTLTRARFTTFSGTSVKTDFVEAPSQMLENWVWKEEGLKKLSAHFQTGQSLPPDLIQKMLAAKHVLIALSTLRQLSFSAIDMAYHQRAEADSTALYAELTRDIFLMPIPSGTVPQASFGHLMGGYDAGYYGYLWSRVFAADLFTRFENEGLFSPTTGADYVRWILEPGGSRDPMDLIRGFLGREPSEEAFLKSLGLTPLRLSKSCAAQLAGKE